MESRPFHVLFVCARNGARSLMAESLLEALGGTRFRAASAGPHPASRADPWAVEALAMHGYRAAGLQAKDWDAFARPGAAPLDAVVMLCARVARMPHPPFPGNPIEAFWPLEDPAEGAGPDEEKRRAYGRTLAVIRRRVQHLTFLPYELAGRRSVAVPLAEIGLF